MKIGGLSRRNFFFLSAAALPALACGDAAWLEPGWVKIRSFKLAGNGPTHRIVHFTDVHYKGDRAYLESVVASINALSPDVVCFTGDLVEEDRFLAETLEILQKIKSPLYGVPGNHDYWCHADFNEIGKVFKATGGAWLLDAQATTPDGKVHITGVTCAGGLPAPLPPKPNGKNVLLTHYPLMAASVRQPFDLLLAGHSHGGQIRIPFYGALLLPYWVGKYDMGMFRVPAGPLYVNPGIGYIGGNSIRFNCRPEITVFAV